MITAFATTAGNNARISVALLGIKKDNADIVGNVTLDAAASQVTNPDV